jgi:hypothetical protein
VSVEDEDVDVLVQRKLDRAVVVLRALLRDGVER